MFNRVLLIILIAINCTSCSYFSSESNDSTRALDTIINFTKVDVSPSFKICGKLLDEAKTNCFRLNMQQLITKKLRNNSFLFEEDIDVITVNVLLNISNKGEISLKKIETTASFLEMNITFEEEILSAISALPTLSPAIKRGIPVATEYTLPIKIKVTEK